MHREVLVRARWRLAEVKAFPDERQPIGEGAISAFYPMRFGVLVNGGDGERPLSCSEGGEESISSPALFAGQRPWWFKWVRPVCRRNPTLGVQTILRFLQRTFYSALFTARFLQRAFYSALFTAHFLQRTR